MFWPEQVLVLLLGRWERAGEDALLRYRVAVGGGE